MTHTAKVNAFGHIGWKYYNTIKKKAMEQEFSWSGLLISLSIAFFIVLISAGILSLMQKSIISAQGHERYINQKVYRLESNKHLNPRASEKINKILLNNTTTKA